MMTTIWIIDDVPENARLVARSLPVGVSGLELRTYLDGDAAVVEFAALLESSGGASFLPDIIFMDYELGGRNGAALTLEIRELCARHGHRGPYIIGHSSVRRCSQEIVAKGGDVAFRKDAREARSADITRAFPDAMSLKGFHGRGAERIRA